MSAEPEKIQHLNRWLSWIREKPLPALVIGIVAIGVLCIAKPYLKAYWSEKGKQAAAPNETDQDSQYAPENKTPSSLELLKAGLLVTSEDPTSPPVGIGIKFRNAGGRSAINVRSHLYIFGKTLDTTTTSATHSWTNDLIPGGQQEWRTSLTLDKGDIPPYFFLYRFTHADSRLAHTVVTQEFSFCWNGCSNGQYFTALNAVEEDEQRALWLRLASLGIKKRPLKRIEGVKMRVRMPGGSGKVIFVENSGDADMKIKDVELDVEQGREGSTHFIKNDGAGSFDVERIDMKVKQEERTDAEQSPRGDSMKAAPQE